MFGVQCQGDPRDREEHGDQAKALMRPQPPAQVPTKPSASRVPVAVYSDNPFNADVVTPAGTWKKII